MGGVFNCCKKTKKKKQNVEFSKKEDKLQIFEFSRQGQKKNKDEVGQDAYELLINSELGENIKYFAVYDGHGSRGKEAALYAQELIKADLLSEKKNLAKLKDKDKASALFRKIYNNVQNKFKKKPQEYENSGTCSISVLLVENHCFIINLGDSRAVIGVKSQNPQTKNKKSAYQMSTDHKVDKQEEKKRIIASGGIVTNDNNGPHRVFSKTEDGPGLAVARTLGDLQGHAIGVSCEPEITYKLMDNEDRFIIIGSDGIWDMLNSAEVVGFVFEKLEQISKDKIAESLVNEARNRWEVINMYKQKLAVERSLLKDNISSQKNKAQVHIFSIDDITAIICFFNNIEKQNTKKENDSNDETYKK